MALSPQLRIPSTPDEVKGPWSFYDLVLEDTRLKGGSLTYQVLKDAVEPPHAHDDFISLWIIDEGEATLDIDGKEFKAVRGEAYWIPAGTPHGIATASEIRFWAVHIPDTSADPGEGQAHDKADEASH